MALLDIQAITRGAAGLKPVYAPAAGAGDTVRVAKSLFLHVKNGHSAAQTVTLVTPGNVSGLAVEDYSAAIPAGEDRMIPVDEVFRAASGLASITYSGVTALTIAAIRI